MALLARKRDIRRESLALSQGYPALLAEAVSTPAEKVQRFTIETLARHLKSASSTTPALIFYGPLAEFEA